MESSQLSRRREIRYETALVATVFFKKWNPFAKKKAVLKDLSWKGFKLEFVDTGHLKIETPLVVEIKIPISQFDISKKRFLKLKIVLKWFDGEHQRAGGELFPVEGERAVVFENLIKKLAKLKEINDK